MKVATVHYHLRRGGVTKVIQTAHESLCHADVDLLVISGEEPTDGVHFDKLEVIPGLNYRRSAYLSVAQSLKDALKDATQKHFGSQPDVWHFHNHSLGKNVLMPLVITQLAEEKAKILLQIHDFPEDGRPKNYVAQRSFFDTEKEFVKSLYPLGSHIHYTTINQRDQNFLKKAGVKSDQLHILPNSVSEIEVTASPGDRPFSQDKKFILYPTRAIRRKNLGELLLLALAYGDEIDFATSLIPENPEWKPVHDGWQKMAEEMKLPIHFGIGQSSEYEFADLIGWADAHLTTSVAEGFGLAFLEPWISGKSIVGRNLPRITGDFADAGISLDHLYERINVPLDWVGKDALRKVAHDTLRTIYLAYDSPLPKNAVDLTFSRWIENECVDFGMLNEEFQRAVINKVAKDSGALKALNMPSIEPCSASVITEKGAQVKAHYSKDSYCDSLTKLYNHVAKSSAGRVKSLPPRKVLAQFLDPWRLNLLRT